MNGWIPYGRHSVDDEDVAAVVRILKSDWLTTGPTVAAFERALARFGGAEHAVTFNSCTSALHAAYFAAGVGPGDEVITTPITFVATANAARYLGASPVFADVQPDTINLDPERVESAISERTRVIAPVDFAGHPADLDEIRRIARSAGAVVVEDAAHALGATYKGRRVGSVSDMTVFSFHPVKGITAGEGGAVLTDDPDYAAKLKLFRNHGITKERQKWLRNEGPWYYEMQELGYNYRLSDIHCALGLSQLRKAGEFLARRRALANAYDEAFTGPEFVRPSQRAYVAHGRHLYPLQLERESIRLQVVQSLHRAGIGVQVHYIPIYRHPYYRRRGYSGCFCPNAERYYRRCLSLPLYPELSDEAIARTIDAVFCAVATAIDTRIEE